MSVVLSFVLYFNGQQDTSVVQKSSTPLVDDKGLTDNSSTRLSDKVNNLVGNSKQNAPASEHRPVGNYNGGNGSGGTRGEQIKYGAKQVIVRDDLFEPDKTMPIGTNLVGKLLTSIDTREPGQLYKVLLPYGGRNKSGAEVPKNTIVFGKISYPGKGDKVFLQIEKGVLPEGQEVQIQGQALSSADYSPGIVGDFHGKAGVRLATTLGLTMLGAASDVLVEKEALGSPGMFGQEGSITPKATMRNAALQGVSKVAQDESNRQAQELNQEPEYVTVDAGTDLIINLTSAFKQERIDAGKSTGKEK